MTKPRLRANCTWFLGILASALLSQACAQTEADRRFKELERKRWHDHDKAIAEVLLFSRRFPDYESETVEKWLAHFRKQKDELEAKEEAWLQQSLEEQTREKQARRKFFLTAWERVKKGMLKEEVISGLSGPYRELQAACKDCDDPDESDNTLVYGDSWHSLHISCYGDSWTVTSVNYLRQTNKIVTKTFDLNGSKVTRTGPEIVITDLLDCTRSEVEALFED